MKISGIHKVKKFILHFKRSGTGEISGKKIIEEEKKNQRINLLRTRAKHSHGINHSKNKQRKQQQQWWWWWCLLLRTLKIEFICQQAHPLDCSESLRVSGMT